MKKSAIERNREAARQFLKRKEIKKYSTTCGFLFDVFLNRDGRILAKDVIDEGLCHLGKFKQWRDDLREKSVLDYRKINDYVWKYFPGSKFVKYINIEKNLTKELATTEDIHRVQCSLDRIINIIDPVATPEKRQRLLNGEYDSKLKTSNSLLELDYQSF